MSREQILRDWKQADEVIDFISKNQGNNYQARISDHYLKPEYNKKAIMPLRHPDGLFIYFINVRKILNKALNQGFIEECELPYNAPTYLEELVREKF